MLNVAQNRVGVRCSALLRFFGAFESTLDREVEGLALTGTLRASGQ